MLFTHEAWAEAWAEAAECLGHPTTGLFAARLWELASSDRLPIDDASALYRACGYIPFSGYPLTRSVTIRTVSTDVDQAMVSNPILRAFADGSN